MTTSSVPDQMMNYLLTLESTMTTSKPAKDWQALISNTTDYSVYYGRWQLIWEYIGEGTRDSYNEDDPEDVPLLRVTLYYEEDEVENGSYCTLAPVDTNQDILNKMSSSLFANLGLDFSMYEKINRKVMQRWTHDTNPATWKKKD